MAKGLVLYQQCGYPHPITFSCDESRASPNYPTIEDLFVGLLFLEGNIFSAYL